MKKYIVLFVILGMSLGVQSQEVTLQKTNPVSKDDKQGYIQTIDVNEADQEIHVIYRINDKKKSVTFHTYTFDFDFNLKGDEIEKFDYEKVPKDKQPKKYEGDEFEVVGLHVEGTLMGKVVLKKKVTKYRWSWWQLAYTINTKIEGKLKVKSENDKKFFYYSHVGFGREGTAMILGGEMQKATTDAFARYKNFEVMKYNVELEKLGGDKFSFDHPHELVQQYQVHGDNDYGMEWVLVFAPFKPKNYTGPKVHKETATEYTVVRVSPEAKVLERFTFESPNSIWRIDQIYKSQNGKLLMFGPSNENTKDYYQGRIYADKKFKSYQMGLFSNGKAEYISVTTIDEFSEKMKTAPDGKKGTAYKGKKFKANAASFAPNGDVIVTGQQFNPNDGKYQDINIFHFDNKGVLKSQYAMNKKYATLALDDQMFEYTADGKYAYWIYFDVTGEQQVKEGDLTIMKPLITPKVGKLNLESGEFEGYIEVGDGDYYCHPYVLNYLIFENQDVINFLGEDKKGKELWFARMPIK